MRFTVVDVSIPIHKSLLWKFYIKYFSNLLLFFFCHEAMNNKVAYFQNKFQTIRIYLKETQSFSQIANRKFITNYLVKTYQVITFRFFLAPLGYTDVFFFFFFFFN
jgi:hypothetical protein